MADRVTDTKGMGMVLGGEGEKISEVELVLALIVAPGTETVRNNLVFVVIFVLQNPSSFLAPSVAWFRYLIPLKLFLLGYKNLITLHGKVNAIRHA